MRNNFPLRVEKIIKVVVELLPLIGQFYIKFEIKKNFRDTDENFVTKNWVTMKV